MGGEEGGEGAEEEEACLGSVQMVGGDSLEDVEEVEEADGEVDLEEDLHQVGQAGRH